MSTSLAPTSAHRRVIFKVESRLKTVAHSEYTQASYFSWFQEDCTIFYFLSELRNKANKTPQTSGLFVFISAAVKVLQTAYSTLITESIPVLSSPLEPSWGELCPHSCKYRKKINDCKLKLGIFKNPNVRMQRGIFWPTPGQNREEVTLVWNSTHVSLSYRCSHLVCVQSTPTARSLSSTSLQTGFRPATWVYFIFCNCCL